MSDNRNSMNRRPGPGGGMGRGPMGGGPHGRMSVEKPKNFGNTMKRLVGYLSKYKATLIFVFICAIASTVFMILGRRSSDALQPPCLKA